MTRAFEAELAELRAALGAIERTAPRPVGFEAGRLSPPSTRRPGSPVMAIVVAVAAVIAVVVPVLLMGDNPADQPPAIGAPDGISPRGPGEGDQDAVPGLEESDLLDPLTLFMRGGHESMSGLYAARELIVATCMTGKGWPYEPVDYGLESWTEAPLTLGGVLQWRREYGFGDTVYPQLSAGDRARLLGAVESNRDYVASLGDEERTRYGEDLDGGAVSEIGGGVPGSCRGIAAASTAPLEDQAITAFWRPLLIEAHESHSELSALRDAWRACMVARGFGAIPELNQLHSYYSSHLQQISDSEERLRWEISIAVADLECAASTYLPVEVEIKYEILEQIAVEFPEHSDLARVVLSHRRSLFPQQTREMLDESGCRNPDSSEGMVASAEAMDGREFQFWVTKASGDAEPNGYIIVELNADGTQHGVDIWCDPPHEPDQVYATSEIWVVAPNEISAQGALASVVGRVPAGAATATVTFSDGSSSDIAVQAGGYFLGLVSRPDITIPNEPTPTIDDPAFNVRFPEPVHVAAFGADGTLIAEADV